MNSGRRDKMSTAARLNLRYQRHHDSPHASSAPSGGHRYTPHTPSEGPRQPSGSLNQTGGDVGAKRQLFFHEGATSSRKRKLSGIHAWSSQDSNSPIPVPSLLHALTSATPPTVPDTSSRDTPPSDATPTSILSDQLVPCEDWQGSTDEEDFELYTNTSKKNKVEEVDEPVTYHCLEMGHFFCLPNEILYFILSFLPIQDIISLSLTSSKMNAAIKLFAFSPPGIRQLLPDTAPLGMQDGQVFTRVVSGNENSNIEIVHPAEVGEHTGICDTVRKFEGLGRLIKHLTTFQPIRSRLKVASFFLNKVRALEHTHQSLAMLSGQSSAYYCFGQLLFSFIRGWDDHQKTRAYNLVQSIGKLEQRVEKVLQSSPFSLCMLERDVRLLHRRVFLDHASRLGEEEYGFWLTLILKPWPITYQARLLYLITAPEDARGFVSRTEECGCSNLQHVMGSVDFSQLANSLRILLEHKSKSWSMDHIISIIDELTTNPNGWCLENVAQLLIHCGKAITKGVLGCRAANSRVDELIVICFYLANACAVKDGPDVGTEENVRWFLDVLQSSMSLLPSSVCRATFLYNLASKWQDYLTALFEDCMPEDAESDEIQTEFLSTLGNFTKMTSYLLRLVMQ